MDQQYGPPGTVVKYPELKFKGDGGTYFGILIVNMLLTMVTLGFYYPWAKAKRLQYLYAATELEGSRFAWAGTGNEMFKGFLKAVGIILAIVAIFVLCIRTGHPVIGYLFYITCIVVTVPFAIHGSMRYHWSRTSWRSIRFGYRGNRNEFIKLFIKEMLLTIFTLGIYGSWMTINLRSYLLGNLRFGSGEFYYEGDGWEYFKMNLKGYLLTIVTLGIYGFWWQADMFRYYIDHLRLIHQNKVFDLRSKASGGDFAGLLIVNMLLFIFTLGIAYAWIQTRTLTFVMNNVTIQGDIELADLAQTEEEYKNATGEDLADMLDLGVI